MTLPSCEFALLSRRSLLVLSIGLLMSFQPPVALWRGLPCAQAAGTEADPGVTPRVISGENAADPGVERVLRLADIAYRNLRSYEADFEQDSETRSIQMQRKSTGKVFFEKPDKMRWSYHEPEAREVYLLADQMLVYLPGKNTVMKQTLGDALPGVAPARLFMGVSELRESFSISLAPPGKEEKGAACLRLVPRQKSGLSAEEIFLWLGEKDFLVVKSESRDILGNITTLVFRNPRTNVKFKDDLFYFQIPADAEVVEEMY